MSRIAILEAFYTFGVQKTGAVNSFVANGEYATIEIEITKERTLYKNGNIDREKTAFDTKLVRYSLQLDKGQLKVSDYQNVKVTSTK